MNTAPPGFRHVVDWPAIDAANAAAVKAFWRSEGALADEAQMEERVKQVVLHALDAEGRVAGVCTALAAAPAQLGQPMYFWRCFVGAQWRSTQLVRALMRQSIPVLEAHAGTHGYPCIGILVELENPRFRERGRVPVWSNPHFTYIGRSARGLDLRVHYFKGARLKDSPR